VPRGLTVVPPMQTSRNTFLRFCALKSVFKSDFDVVFANASQTLKPFKIHLKTWNFNLKQLNQTRLKITYTQNCLETTFTWKTNFSPKRFFLKIRWSKTEILSPLFILTISSTHSISSKSTYSFLTHITKNSSNNNNLNHNNTISDTQGMNHHQQH
jgi:hypothetical protein